MTKYAKCSECGYVIAIPDDKNSSDYVCPNDGNTLTDATESEYDESTHIKGPYSAIVYKDGSSVYAEDANGTTIAEGEAGVDDASVIQSAINNGGKVFITVGAYFADDIAINNPVIIEGAGGGTRIRGGSDKHVFIIGQNGSYSQANPLAKVVIRDMEIGGSSSQYGKGAIDAAYTDHLQIENLYIPYISGSAIDLHEWWEFTQIRNVRVYGSGSSFKGISAVYGLFLYVNNFQAGAAKGQGTGIYVHNINDLKFEQIGLAFLSSCIHCLTTKLNIDSIWIENADYGFYVSWGYGGIVRGLHNAGNVDTLEYYENTDYRIEYVPIYKTKNTSTATFSANGSATQFSIAHGLVATPSNVQVTPRSADAAGDFYVTANGSNIQVNYSNPPPSGTDNVVLGWEAEL